MKSAGAYYNEIDPYAAAWLRNLIKAGHIAPGIVDERSIEDICPDELAGYTQCHFFAGIGVWSYALRRAGWDDSRRVWTGSCPCQPFSTAGEGAGFADERHLWPAFHHLIREHTEWCSRQKLALPVILGEQVASKDADAWLDLVQDDMEAMGYAFGALAFPSAGVGAPHIRDRTYWVGDASGAGLERHPRNGGTTRRKESGGPATQASILVRLADTDPDGFGTRAKHQLHHAEHNAQSCSPVFGLANADSIAGRQGGALDSGGHQGSNAQSGCGLGGNIESDNQRPGPTNGFWRAADWLACTDGKWRPVEPDASPLVNGIAGRLVRGRPYWHAPAGKEGFGHRAGRLKGYGNAINAEAACEFILAIQ